MNKISFRNGHELMIVSSHGNNNAGRGFLQNEINSSGRAMFTGIQSPLSKLSLSQQLKSTDEFGQYPLQSHGRFREDLDQIDGEVVLDRTVSEEDTGEPPKPQKSIDSDNFPFVQINAFIWFCTSSVQDEADASYILLSEFMQIGMSFLKVISSEFNEKSASRQVSTLFKKYIPSFLSVSPKIGFDGFNLAMIDFATKALPDATTQARVLWLGKVHRTFQWFQITADDFFHQ